MARLHTVLLPNGGFSYILDQYTIPPTDGVDKQRLLDAEHRNWGRFAELVGAKGILITANTVEIVNPFENDYDEDDEDDYQGCHDPLSVLPLSRRASEAEQRLFAAVLGESRCGCVDKPDAKQPPAGADDNPATDQTPSGDDGAPAGDRNHWAPHVGGVPEPCMPSADSVAAAFADADKPTAEEISARVADAVRERGGPTLELVASDELTEREQRVRTILATSGTSPLICGAVSGRGFGCSLPTGHESLHDFSIMGVGTEAAPEA